MLVRNKDAIETSLNVAGVLWVASYDIDIAAVNQDATSNACLKIICDLTAYPWNHSRGSWNETYASRAYRFPLHVRSGFLGVAEDAQNPHEPRWKNYLRVFENPWIGDHTITDTVLYPAAGVLVMALERALQAANQDNPIEGFRMEDVMFERGLVISLDDISPVETRVSFHAHPEQKDAWIFTVYSMKGGSPWTKHFTGTVTVVYEAIPNGVEDFTIDALLQKRACLRTALMSQSDSIAINPDALYENLDAIGVQYGASFRKFVSLTALPSKDASYGSVTVPDTAATMPENHESHHVIHTATMDSIFHLVIGSLNSGRPVEQAAVPYSIEEMYVAYYQPQIPGSLYTGYGRLLSQTLHEITTELVISDQEWTKPKLTVKNFALRQVTAEGSANAVSDTVSLEMGKKCAVLTWIPDLSFVNNETKLDNLVPTSGKNISLYREVSGSRLPKDAEQHPHCTVRSIRI